MTEDTNKSIEDFSNQAKDLSKKIWSLCEHPISKANPKIEDHLIHAGRALINSQNSLWNEYFNYGRMKREREEKQDNKNGIFTIIKSIFGL